MRLLLANPYYLPYHGGIEGRIEGLARGFAGRGHDVAVLTSQLPGTARREEKDGYTILRCPALVLQRFPYNPPPSWTRGVREAAEAWKPDVLDYHYRWAPEWNHAFRHLAERTPLVVTWHNGFGEGQGLAAPLSRANDARYLRDVASRARRILCISDFVRDGLLAQGAPASKLVTVPPGFDIPAPSTRPGQPGQPGQPGHSASGGRTGDAVFVGRLVATKGLDVLLHALALPAARDVHVTLCGKGPQRAKLEALAARLGVQERVRFAGFVSEAEKLRLLHEAPFLAHPAREEALGHALAEAMLQACPVVGSKVGGIPEVVGPGGILVPPGDAAALAEAMGRLWHEPGLAEALRWKARAQAERFTWERCVAATLRVYEDALASAAPPAPSSAPPSAPRSSPSFTR